MRLLTWKYMLSSFGIFVPIFFSTLDWYYTSHRIDYWNNYTPDPGPWCEYAHPVGFIKEKSNARSDYTFLFYSLYIMYDSILVHREMSHTVYRLNPLCEYPILILLYGFINFMHFWGTFINHSCRCAMGHQMDLFWMYLIVGYWLIYYSLRLSYYQSFNSYFLNNYYMSNRFSREFICYLFCVAAIIYPLTKIKYSYKYSDEIETMAMLSLGLPCMYLDYRCRKNVSKRNIRLSFYYGNKMIILGITTILSGVLFHKIDVHHVVCDPTMIVQPHAIWHVFASTTAFIAYIHAKNENIVSINNLPLQAR